MKTCFLLLLTLLAQPVLAVNNLYIRHFGDPKQPALVFLHGGPGMAAVDFEVAAAQQLADAGFYVILYDRRGEGRSQDSLAKFTFDEASADLLAIIEQNKLKQVHLLGYSFGGMVASAFAKRYPEKVKSIVLLGAPLKLQDSFRHIRQTAANKYHSKNDSAGLARLAAIEQYDTSDIHYSSACFYEAMLSGAYQLESPDAEQLKRYEDFRNDSLIRNFGFQPNFKAPMGYWKNEAYTSLNIGPDLRNLQQQGIHLFVMVGKEDGLYGQAAHAEIRALVSHTDRFLLVDKASHGVFLDQPYIFVEQLKQWLQ